MAKYRTFDDLCIAAVERLNQLPHPITAEIAAADADLQEIIRLVNIYCDAESNPPEGIIGVGCITYAQQMLEAAQ